MSRAQPLRAGGPPLDPERLVSSPVFVLSSIRSGSTLLRCLLDTHPRIRAPHEMHLADLQVRPDGPYVRLAMAVSGLDNDEIEHLLWDRLLHRELMRSGADVIVDKTPGNLLLWRRLARCWPQARFVFLLRHPAHILQSALAGRPECDPASTTELVFTYLRALHEARDELPGLTVRYEDLTTKPAQVTRGLCDYLQVPWEATVLDYGRVDHGPFVWGIGDFGAKIKTGVVLPGRVAPPVADVPAELRPICADLGYLDVRE
ncbi:MAG: sulfotransferase family protein [Micromonosporaceae bacterium]